MKNIDSISTSCLANEACEGRRLITGAVCQKCYAKKYLTHRPNLNEKLIDNMDILTTELLQDSDFPIINAHTFRLESFGELVNEIHLTNYIKLCELNPRTVFGLWTKELAILGRVFETVPKPQNLVITLSSPYINKPFDMWADVWYIDHVFTVYEKKFAKDNGIDINCGKKKCIECLKCYSKDTEFYINELLK